MNIAKITNSQNPYFGTKVMISPCVLENFSSNYMRSLNNQISTLENNGTNDVLLLSCTPTRHLIAEVYSVNNGRIISGYPVEEPFYNCTYDSLARKTKHYKSVNIVKLYQKASNTIYSHQITDKRIGTRAKKWENYIPGIKEI